MKKFLLILVCLALNIGSLYSQVPLHYRLEGQKASPSSSVIHLQTWQGRESKSATLAVLLSLVLPGAGEWYAGNFSTGKYFFIADGSLWLTYAAFQYRGDWIRNDARSFAALNSGAHFSGKDEDFDVNIGNYSSVDEYNQAQLRERQYDQIYSSAEFSWRWNNDADRARFRDKRIQSDEMYENAKFVFGALVINRLVSAFSAGRSAVRYGSPEAHQGAWQMGAGVQGGILDAHGIVLRVSKEF